MIIRQRKFLSTVLFGFLFTSILLKLLWFNPGVSMEEERLLPIIFVGGFPRSGTTLMRVLLDTHPAIRCGQETHVIPKLLMHIGRYQLREKERLDAAGVTERVLNTAVASFILNIIKRHGKSATILCNKDPLTLRNMTYLTKLFPNSRFIFMIRDGRAVIHSMITRNIIIGGLRNQSYDKLLRTWSDTVTGIDKQCKILGPHKCVSVHYERLVLFPAQTMKTVLSFVGVDWNDKVLHHEKFVGTPMGPAISSLEKSSDQVVEPIYHRSLYIWKETLPKTVRKSIDTLAPALKTLGYDTESQIPDYTTMALKP